MKCFYHEVSEAVGLCKNCSKGICRQCAVDLGNGLACIGKCEEQVTLLNKLIERNMGLTEKSTKNLKLNKYSIVVTSVAMLLLGIVLCFLSFSEDFKGLIYYGVGMVLFGTALLSIALKY